MAHGYILKPTVKLNIKKTLWPFLLMGFNCLKVIEPLRGDSLLFTIQMAMVY